MHRVHPWHLRLLVSCSPCSYRSVPHKLIVLSFPSDAPVVGGGGGEGISWHDSWRHERLEVVRWTELLGMKDTVDYWYSWLAVGPGLDVDADCTLVS